MSPTFDLCVCACCVYRFVPVTGPVYALVMQSLSSNSSATVGSLVMFSDARDVMFQSDPFQRMTRHMADNGNAPVH